MVLIACANQEPLPIDPYSTFPAVGPELDEILAAAENRRFLEQLSFVPAEAQYYKLVDQVIDFTSDELALLEQNGFVISDRLAFTDFTTAYAYIYWKDLPVLVTTDSILHSIHQSYDDLLMGLEETILTSKLTDILRESRRQLQLEASANTDPNLNALYADLEIYLTVPLTLLTGTEEFSFNTPGARAYFELAKAADTVTEINLFGGQRKVDFTLFKPRGHYTEREELERYFQAKSWLAQVDLRLAEYDPQGNPKLNIEHVAAAALLREVIDKAEQRSTWQEFDLLFSTLVGHSDNVTLPDLDRFLADAGVNAPSDILSHPDPDQLLTLLTTNDYGQQRITGQILRVAPDNLEPISRPVSFMLLGQRFVVDAYLMSNLVYDRLLVDGRKVQRPLPNPLDIMYALGNERAATHLKSELSRYGYQANLSALRASVDAYDRAFWISSFYNRWLGTLRKLNVHTISEIYPQSMRTAAWADKMLHTQLASWAQLRHDNILYAKQSVTGELICEYPAGYVEPYPEFYAAIQDYAQAGSTLFENLNSAKLAEHERDFVHTAVTYFDNLDVITAQLQTMSEKELRQEPFSAEEERFLKSIAIQQIEQVDNGCAVITVERWSGWYLDLFPWKDDNPALIADVHTNPNNDPSFKALYPPSVLHAGTGPVAPIVFIADTNEGPTMYVGPAFTYYEVIKEGFPPVRLTNEAWDEWLNSSLRPTPPNWTKSFRVSVSEPPRYLELPAAPGY
jgi:hypothetical protein